jgi:hypothetical protein
LASKSKSNVIQGRYDCGWLDSSFETAEKGKNGGRTTEALAMAKRSNMDYRQRRDVGTDQRRRVLGDTWVDKSIASRNSFNSDFGFVHRFRPLPAKGRNVTGPAASSTEETVGKPRCCFPEGH